ncbi:MAG TPA: hypothetical protein VMX56_09350 [Anaerolineales bacterium]|nr:hypothetical protein [Anaerolineales bacterium]
MGPPPTGAGQPPEGIGVTGAAQLTGVGPPPTGVGQPPIGVGSSKDLVGYAARVGRA